MSVLTLDEVKARIEPIAEANPDKAPGCIYFGADDTPCCIVGHAFESELREAGMDGSSPQNSISIDILAHQSAAYGLELDVAFTQEAMTYLRIVQQRQDSGWSWAEAVAYANEALQ